MAGGTEIILILLRLASCCLWLLFVVRIAERAQQQGRSYNTFLAISLFLTPLVGLIVLCLVGDNLARDGHLVYTLRKTHLVDGTKLKRRFVARVAGSKTIDGTPVVQLAGPTGLVWIARDNVRKAR